MDDYKKTIRKLSKFGAINDFDPPHECLSKIGSTVKAADRLI